MRFQSEKTVFKFLWHSVDGDLLVRHDKNFSLGNLIELH